MANALINLGVKKGDTVSTYMPMCPELLIALLACTKIGAVHSVIYSGLSVGAFVDRINDAKVKVLFTADGTYRRGKVINLKSIADEAILQCPTVETIVVVNHTGTPIEISELSGREIFYDRLIEGEPAYCEPEPMDSEDPLFILYTSGSTGKPKGVLHTTGGYMVGTATTTRLIFDIHDDDLWWCTGDIGWITGHSYVLYGPLLLGTTTVVYEGAPDYPDPGVWWKIVEKYGVTKFYTAPTAIRHLMRFGTRYTNLYNLDSLRILGTVGEPMNPEAWMWYYKNVGKEKCPIMDTWWQTETGMHLISPIPISPLNQDLLPEHFLESKLMWLMKKATRYLKEKEDTWLLKNHGQPCSATCIKMRNVSLMFTGKHSQDASTEPGTWYAKMKMDTSGYRGEVTTSLR
ncbi:hypothetical protein GCM10025861_18540 [Methanobacterium petrolearium]|nr:hypothetical protein GCM10025861_18540 [Methanobacterium petrolearium]